MAKLIAKYVYEVDNTLVQHYPNGTIKNKLIVTVTVVRKNTKNRYVYRVKWNDGGVNYVNKCNYLTYQMLQTVLNKIPKDLHESSLHYTVDRIVTLLSKRETIPILMIIKDHSIVII